jgi:hypothetical protein
MSYINDALHKVQNDKEAPYASWAPPVAAGSPKNRSGRTPALSGRSSRFWFWRAAWLCGGPRGRNAGSQAGKNRPASGCRGNDPAPARFLRLVKQSRLCPRRLSHRIGFAGQDVGCKKGSGSAVRTGEPQAGSAAPEMRKASTRWRWKSSAKGVFGKRRVLYRRVLKKEPRHFRAQNNLGVVYLRAWRGPAGENLLQRRASYPPGLCGRALYSGLSLCAKK